MSKNITIARLNTLVTANASQFTQELDRAGAVAKSRGRSINGAFSGLGSTIAGAFSIGAVIGFGKSIADLGGQISDLASVADLSQRGFQTISMLAGDSGVKMEEVAKASETMRQKLQDAKTNASDPLNKSLAKLGLTSAGLSGLNTDQKWEVIAAALVKAKDQQEAMNIASDIFGAKIGPKLRGTLGDIAGGVENAAQGMSGLIISDEQLKRIDAFGDSVQRLGRFVQVLAVNLLDGSVGFQGMLRGAKEMVGIREARAANDIRNPGGFVLPGSKLAPERTRQQQLADAMAEAQKKEWAQGEKEYRAELKQIEDRKRWRMSDPANQLKTRKALDELTKPPAGQTTPNAPTDQYSKIGLMSTDRAPVAGPQKEQTEHLKKIRDILDTIKDGLAKIGQPTTAAYGN